MYPNTAADDATSANGTGPAEAGSETSPQTSPPAHEHAPATSWTPPEPPARRRSLLWRWLPRTAPARRRSLVPRWLPWTALAIAAVVAVTAGLIVWRSRTGLIQLPNVQGLDVRTATGRLQEVGMRVELGDRRFSATVARGGVVEQTPRAGTEVQPGSVVVLAVSAGSENFPMPDVVGATLERARRSLEAKGLQVVVDVVPSEQASGTVVSTYPSAGVTLSTGESVRLTVASTDNSGGLLLPTDLRGRTFILDPAPMPVAGTSDPPMDVARRLRALLEASGATVVVTRDVLDSPGVSVDVRAQRAKANPSTALVGFSVISAGAPGIAVLTVPADSTTSSFFIDSATLGNAVHTNLRTTFPAARTTPGTGDALLVATGAPAARVVLGSAAAPADARSFTDPAWADSVARAVYRGLGSLYGTK